MAVIDEETRRKLKEKFLQLRDEGMSLEMARVMLRAMVEEEKEASEMISLEQKKSKVAGCKNSENLKQHVQDVTSMDLPLDFENAFSTDFRAENVFAESVSDGLILSLTNLGKVDIEYISVITGVEMKDVIFALKGAIYQNPDTWGECFYKGWETAEEYLSGNLFLKYYKAKKANEIYDGYFLDNMTAIKKVFPKAVTANEIYVTLGSPWLPVDIVDEFIVDLFEIRKQKFWTTTRDKSTGTWNIAISDRNQEYVKMKITYGTSKMHALTIIEHSLNMQSAVVYRYYQKNGKKKRVVDKDETALATEKQKLLLQKFKEWVWKTPQRTNRLEQIYARRYGCIKARLFDGSFLTFPSMASNISLFDYQKNAVARILFTPNTLLAHDVGSGKTYIMIAAAMELRRMGLSKKNLFVVPNNIVGQWREIFLNMYPNAKLLCVEPKNFVPEKRKKVLEQIRDNDFDGILMAYSSFELIKLSKQFYLSELQEDAKNTKAAILQATGPTTELVSKQRRIAEEIAKLLAKDMASSIPFFDELGITRLFVDEAHNYKNMPIATKSLGINGISPTGSKKCSDMLNKVRFIQKTNNGGGVVFATGTPITNSLTDIFVMQQYLQSGELALLNLGNFDSWIGMFAQAETGFEIDVDTTTFRIATRFSKFHNLPELTTILASIADFHIVPSGGILPDFDGYTDTLISKTKELEAQLKLFTKRADAIRNGEVLRKDDNMLKITIDGRKAALDLRLVNKNATFSPASKVVRCAENVFDIYKKTSQNSLTQLVFCDSSVPKPAFNMYDELARILVSMGVPHGEIAFVHNAVTDNEREALFQKVNDGDIRILLGSTFKLGTGVNVQEKLIAVHHLDIPWRPSDMIQREGRILRPGNTNKKIYIFRYITEGSFDAYSWQLLESKQKFIAAILSGSVVERSKNDIDDCVLNYAEVKALAVGNPLIKKRVETANELARYVTLQKKNIETKENMNSELLELQAEQKDLKVRIERTSLDVLYLNENVSEMTKEARLNFAVMIYDAVCANELLQNERVVAEYRGFEVILPAHMTLDKKFIYLKRNGKYNVQIADSDKGALIRIDNLLNELPEILQKHKKRLVQYVQKQEDIKKELAKKDDYAIIIESLKDKLKNIDLELGVIKNE